MVLGVGEPTRIVEVAAPERRRFALSDSEIHELARYALRIEAHYGCPMDIEWAKDGADGRLYILQARPETVKSRGPAQSLEWYSLKERAAVLVSGRSIGQRIGAGRARVIARVEDMSRFQPGEVLVADMTDPDWEPVMKRAAGIVTNRGGRTCHAAIVARELGVPAVVGTDNATECIGEGREVTVSCAEGEEGFVYDGKLAFERSVIKLETMPALPVKIMMNVANPDRAFEFAAIPNQGIGLARLEFIINRMIGIHPQALLQFDRMPRPLQERIIVHTQAYPDPVSFFVDKLAEGIAVLAAAFAPKPVIVRLSDFKSNEYRNLLGGEHFEPAEEIPCSDSEGLRAISLRASATASSLNAPPCARCARRWG